MSLVPLVYGMRLTTGGGPNKGIRSACECKNRKLILEDIYVFTANFAILALAAAFLVTTTKETQRDVLLAAEANGLRYALQL